MLTKMREFPPRGSVKGSPGLVSKEERGVKERKPNFGEKRLPVKPEGKE